MKQATNAPAARERLRTAVEALPARCSLALSRETLLHVLADEAPRDSQTQDSQGLAIDLTVVEVARLFGRSPNTIRRWLESGKLPGYKLLGREWRVTRSAIAAFQQEQKENKEIPLGLRRSSKSLSDWRKIG